MFMGHICSFLLIFEVVYRFHRVILFSDMYNMISSIDYLKEGLYTAMLGVWNLGPRISWVYIPLSDFF